MLYFYESSGRYYHDRDCLEVKQIASERFAASEEIPDNERYVRSASVESISEKPVIRTQNR